MEKQTKKTIEDCIIDLFNQLHHSKRIRTRLKTLEHNLVATYICDNIKPESCTNHYGRAAFASFAKKYLRNDVDLEKYLVDRVELEFDNDMNVDPLIKYCLSSMRIDTSDHRKTQLVRDKCKELEPNNAAIMAGVLYKEIFRNKNLLEYVRTAKDADDLKALLFIDYIFRSTSNAGIDDIMDGRGCLESKALKVDARVYSRFLESTPSVHSDGYPISSSPVQSSQNVAAQGCIGTQIAYPSAAVEKPASRRYKISRKWKAAALAAGLGALLTTSALGYVEHKARISGQQEMLRQHCMAEPWNQYCNVSLYKKK